MSAMPSPRGKPKPPKEPKTLRLAELLLKAIERPRQLDAGEGINQTQIVRREGLTRARVTQVIGMLRLTAEIQERILSLPAPGPRRLNTERALRRVAAIKNSRDQLREFKKMTI